MSCCGLTRRKAMLYGLAVLIGCTVTIALVIITPRQPNPYYVEMVSVPVPVEDLPEGTRFTKDNVDRWTRMSERPKATISEETVMSRGELIGSRLTRSVFADEPIRHKEMKKDKRGSADVGVDRIGVHFSVSQSPAMQFKPGDVVDVLGIHPLGKVPMTFLLVPQGKVTVINGQDDRWTVGIPVTQEQFGLVTLAKQRGCQLDLVPYHPDGALDSPQRIERTAALLRGLGEFPVAPMPRAKE